ncbi:alpha-ketoglutarate decarboxylase [Mesonia maritima]|uniref:Long-subunit fatty acid transport protein n=1 Tax=Mesonia maritima TaxID=1793873 RepID=A0ABU1KA85_9FLAO|nr:alpha-ketoglutarate decarboxylase [Mesonia maritima]MDR6301498.1 long-subunit fatty acid transport protein [Mesonia maritima]
MKKIFFTFLPVLFLFIGFSSMAQFNLTSKTDSFWDRVSYGGGIGLSFGNNFFSGSISPSAVYQVNSYFATGVGLNFTYANIYDDTSIVYGGSLLGFFRPLREIQLSAEFEELSVNRSYEINSETIDENYWYPALFLGAGYNTGPVTIGVRYDVLYDDDKSIYASPFMPFLRVYF